MSWKAFGKFLFFVGLGIFVYNLIHSAVFASYYGVWATGEVQETTAYRIFDWFHSFRFAINDGVLGWPTLMILGGGLWIGGRKPGTG